jgi:hypothetical protein
MLNKRGQGLQISTVVLLILGIAILVILVLGFTIGWQKLLPFISSNNINTIVSQCQASCTTSDTYGYCSLERTLTADDLPGTLKEAKGNCTFFATDPSYAKYAIAQCPGLCPSA